MLSRAERVINTLLEEGYISITNCGYVVTATDKEMLKLGITDQEIRKIRNNEAI